MVRPRPDHIVIVGAGAAGLMAARVLGLAGKRVTIWRRASDTEGASIRSRLPSLAIRRKAVPNSFMAKHP